MRQLGAILIVDAHEPARERLADLLWETGHVVLTAARGDDAASLIEDLDRPCLLVVDPGVPALDDLWAAAGRIDRDLLVLLLGDAGGAPDRVAPRVLGRLLDALGVVVIADVVSALARRVEPQPWRSRGAA